MPPQLGKYDEEHHKSYNDVQLMMKISTFAVTLTSMILSEFNLMIDDRITTTKIYFNYIQIGIIQIFWNKDTFI